MGGCRGVLSRATRHAVRLRSLGITARWLTGGLHDEVTHRRPPTQQSSTGACGQSSQREIPSFVQCSGLLYCMMLAPPARTARCPKQANRYIPTPIKPTRPALHTSPVTHRHSLSLLQCHRSAHRRMGGFQNENTRPPPAVRLAVV